MKKDICHCVVLRKASRKVTSYYDDALAPLGINVAQFSLLRHIDRMAPVSLTDLGARVELDRSTVGRNAKVLERMGLAIIRPGKDQREATLTVSEAGQGVLESVHQGFSALAHDGCSDDATSLIAWLGPCIGPEVFEVGEEVKAAFVQTDPGAAELFRPGRPGKWWANLPGLARRRLQALGVAQIYGNDGSQAWCTVHNPLRFFSYRRDQVALGGSGRFAACVWIDAGGR